MDAEKLRNNHRAIGKPMSLKMKTWRYQHPEQFQAQQRKQNRTLSGKFAYLKNRAKREKRKINITFKQYKSLVSSQKCFYCGKPLPLAGYGIDRIDSTKGYVVKNVRPCCTVCNLAKNKTSEKEFRKWVIRIYHHWIK
jgi:hypothetical protein